MFNVIFIISSFKLPMYTCSYNNLSLELLSKQVTKLGGMITWFSGSLKIVKTEDCKKEKNFNVKTEDLKIAFFED